MRSGRVRLLQAPYRPRRPSHHPVPSFPKRGSVETGLLLKVTYDPDKHDLPEWLKGDVEPGDDYFEFSPALRSALADPIPEAPADEEVEGVAEQLREHLKMKYAGNCKCGACQLVPIALIENTILALRRSTETDKPGVREAAGDDEMYEIGKRDGYEEAVQDIDLMTGGDGEYRVAVFLGGGVDEDRHCPDPAAMKARIAERFVALSAPLTEEQPVATEVVEALRPFAQAFAKADDPGVSDLYDEQPFSLHVPLGAWRRARSVCRQLAASLGLDALKPNLVTDADELPQCADIDSRQPENNLNVAPAQVVNPVGGVEQPVNDVLFHEDAPPADVEREYVDGFPISSPGGRV